MAADISSPPVLVYLKYSFESFCKLNSPLPLKNTPASVNVVGIVGPIAIVPPLEDEMCCVEVSKSNVLAFIFNTGLPPTSNLI